MTTTRDIDSPFFSARRKLRTSYTASQDAGLSSEKQGDHPLLVRVMVAISLPMGSTPRGVFAGSWKLVQPEVA